MVHREKQVVDDLIIQPAAEQVTELATHSEVLRRDDLMLVPVRVRGMRSVRQQVVNLRVHHK